MIWHDSPSLGKSGFVQSRLFRVRHDSYAQLAEVEFHAPIYHVSFQVRGLHTTQSPEFKSLEEAKGWAAAVVGVS